jgi:Replication protein
MSVVGRLLRSPCECWLTLTEPNSSWNDFGSAIGRLLSAIAKLMRYKRVRAAVKHSFRALEVTCPRPGEFHPHFYVLLVVPAAYLEAGSSLYIAQEEWAAM